MEGREREVGGVGERSRLVLNESRAVLERKVAGQAGWSRAGLLNGSLVENSCVNGGRRWADSASGPRRTDC